MERQKAVLINAMDCQEIKALTDITRHLLGSEDQLLPHTKTDEIESHLWKADTKYYSAEIDLTVARQKSIMNEKFSESVEAVLLYFDSSKDSDGLGRMKSWMTFIDTWEPSVKLAVCERCSSDGTGTLSRVKVQEWCLDHEFELVELNPDFEDYDEYEDTGLKRIRSALLAHMWPSMDMKNPNDAVRKVPTPCGVAATKGATASHKDVQRGIDLLKEENEFDDIIGDESENENFEKLFSNLKVMKDQASCLPAEERKKFAEDMVKAFWTALGGDKAEFEGLSSDDEGKAESHES